MSDLGAEDVSRMRPGAESREDVRELVQAIYEAFSRLSFAAPVCPAEIVALLTRDDSARTYARLPPLAGDVVFFYDDDAVTSARAAIVVEVLGSAPDDPLTLHILYPDGIRVKNTVPHTRPGTRRGRWSRRREAIIDRITATVQGDDHARRDAEHPGSGRERDRESAYRERAAAGGHGDERRAADV